MFFQSLWFRHWGFGFYGAGVQVFRDMRSSGFQDCFAWKLVVRDGLVYASITFSLARLAVEIPYPSLSEPTQYPLYCRNPVYILLRSPLFSVSRDYVACFHDSWPPSMTHITSNSIELPSRNFSSGPASMHQLRISFWVENGSIRRVASLAPASARSANTVLSWFWV